MSLSFNTILFPVDFSDRCRGAAHYVEALAGRFGSRLILLHVLETTIGQPGDLDFGGFATSLQWEDRTARTQELLDHFLVEELSLLPVTRILENGDPARTIIRVAQAEKADLIMLPTHGYGGFRRFILGSVTAKVLHDAECPVWTGVHLESAPPLDSIQIKRVLCAVDLTLRSEAVIAAGAQLAEEYGAELALAHAVPGSEAIPEKLLDCELRRHLMSQAREQLLELATRCGVNASLLVDSGETASVVDGLAKNWQADLVVIGRAQHHGFGRLRTHAYSIIRESPCPVLSI
jgi:nucleotide-binding universal stress UspA family protein